MEAEGSSAEPCLCRKLHKQPATSVLHAAALPETRLMSVGAATMQSLDEIILNGKRIMG